MSAPSQKKPHECGGLIKPEANKGVRNSSLILFLIFKYLIINNRDSMSYIL